MSLYAELVRKAADQYRSQLDAIYAQQKLINRADHIAGLLLKAGLQAKAQADDCYHPFILLQLSEELQPLQKTVLLYVSNVLECQIEENGSRDGLDCFLIPPGGDTGQARLPLLVESAQSVVLPTG
ncbi:hypothetical protein KIF53_03630 [Chromobacterium subtsugae]|uniref:Uncharacterized protein n=1 Tax=Chromobacterium subtsugae TaxID=251747 RepID=A0ABS7F9E4_9NEIS|nr:MULTISPECIES: hypothetical protein [Chromobacterium]KUM02553.1 hypothetical protein Cv017_02215 [Chromobacterium subtsugae]KZE87938.1 hypothetical protein AWB61_09050 [Chromobacterium sp. F49]MBW7565434.1 hypothetical protein [Chromobacterium subtsugae]MBW8286716.1 hypothetical protein [Chromobacterium subtsugae]WSE90804.1 hypothetical protein U6115_18225 [Chromobacterium subtsugae]